MSINRRNIFSVIGIFIMGAIIGGAIGIYGASHFLGSFFSYGSNLSQIASIKDRVFTLSKLREGQPEKAIEHIEMALDVDLMYFSAGIHGSENIKKDIITALKSAKDYRVKFPRSTNHSEIDRAVAKSLAEAVN